MKSIILNSCPNVMLETINNSQIETFCYSNEQYYTTVKSDNAGWVIASTREKETTFLLEKELKFETNGTGHEMLFGSQELAIVYIIQNNLRNCWVMWKMC